MIKPINKDTMILMKKATSVTSADLPIAQDLLDTLNANSERCVGMAANMIAEPKAVIAVNVGFMSMLMLNPKIVAHSAESYETEEGCLSLSGVRKVKRYQSVTVEYQDTQFKKHKNTYSGFTAQIIQHEIDHLFGKLI